MNQIKNEIYFTIVRQRLDTGERVWIPVLGESMQPFLRARDKVLLQTVEATDVTKGDIVLARWNQMYVLHRVVRKKAGLLWLAGDNNLVQIEKIAAEDLLAVLAEAKREERPLPVSSPFNKALGILWYYARLPRRVFAALKRSGH